jgi:hypothetical protein
MDHGEPFKMSEPKKECSVSHKEILFGTFNAGEKQS